jgi:hypothetical protein
VLPLSGAGAPLVSWLVANLCAAVLLRRFRATRAGVPAAAAEPPAAATEPPTLDAAAPVGEAPVGAAPAPAVRRRKAPLGARIPVRRCTPPVAVVRAGYPRAGARGPRSRVDRLSGPKTDIV